jgi:hypothetical protein
VAQRINPGMIGALFLCALLTIVFTVMVVFKGNEARKYLEGDPERPNTPTLAKLQDEQRSLLKDMEQFKADISLRQRELERADLELARHRVYLRGEDMLGGVATPGNENGTIDGKQVRLKDHVMAVVQNSIKQSADRLEALKSEYASPARQSFPALDASIRKRQDELQAINARITDQDGVFQKDRAQLAEKLDALKGQLDKEDRAIREERSRRQTRIAQLEDRIRELLELELRWLTEIEPVGNVLTVEDRSQRVIIDLGSDERAFPGLLFEVFNYEKGVYVDKGMIEVIEVKPGIAVCRILKQNNAKLYPMAKDDRIGNPTYSPKKPKVFVVAGEFSQYNKTDLEAFIRRSGGIVQDKLGPGVDYLVAGARSEREQATAREYQVLGMKEEQLLKYVQPLFSPKK